MKATTKKKNRGVYEHPKGSGIWKVLWYDINGVRHRETAGTKSAALALKDKRTTDRREARKIPETLRHTPDAKFSELCTIAQTEADHENGVSAQNNLRGIIKALAPTFGSRSASTITTAELLQWLRTRKKQEKWKDGTYNQYVVQLCVIFQVGVDAGLVTGNPARREGLKSKKGLKRIPLDNEKVRYLREDEAARFATVFSERWPEHWNAYQFARNTGLRAGAQFNLKWTQVDMERRTITLPPKRNSKYKKNWVLPINPVVYPILVELRAASNGSPFVFASYHEGPDYLLKPANWFPEIVKAAEIVEDEVVGKFTWHSLRHDFASQLVMRGENLKTVSLLMCHTNIKQTAKYADLAPVQLQSAVERLAEPLPVYRKRTATTAATQLIEFPLSA